MKPAAGHPLQLVLGFSAWLLWFAIVYGGSAVACKVAAPHPGGGPYNWVNAALLLLTLATAAALTAAAFACHRAGREPAGQSGPHLPQRARFIAQAAAWLHGAAALSTLVVGLPMVVLPACG